MTRDVHPESIASKDRFGAVQSSDAERVVTACQRRETFGVLFDLLPVIEGFALGDAPVALREEPT